MEDIETSQSDITLTGDKLEIIRDLVDSRRVAGALLKVKALREDYKTLTRVIPLVSKAAEIQREIWSDSALVRVLLYKRAPQARVVAVKNGMLLFDAPTLQGIPELTQGYAYKGGVARLYLAKILGIEASEGAARDLDLVRVGTESDDLDEIVAQKFMPEDLKFGHGIELVPNIRTYLATRDLTINEVIFRNGRVIVSEGALQDTLSRVLRRSDFIKSKPADAQGRTIAKMLRFLAQSVLLEQPYRLEEICDIQKIAAFDLALHLERALQSSVQVARLYILECIRREFLPETIFKSEQVESELTTVLNEIKRHSSSHKRRARPMHCAKLGRLAHSPLR